MQVCRLYNDVLKSKQKVESRQRLPTSAYFYKQKLFLRNMISKEKSVIFQVFQWFSASFRIKTVPFVSAASATPVSAHRQG